MSENNQNQDLNNELQQNAPTSNAKSPMPFEEKAIKFLIANTIISAITLIVALIILFSHSLKLPANDAPAPAPKMAKAPKGVLIPSQAYRKFDDYNKTIAEKDKMAAVVFYADWCGFCRKSVPIFLDLAKDKDLKKMYNFTFVNGDTPDGSMIMRQYGANAYPSLFVVNPNDDTKHQIENEIIFGINTEKSLADEMKKFFEEQNG